MAKIKYVGDGPNDPTAVIIQNAYAFGRGKSLPPARKLANPGGGGMGQGATQEMMDDLVAEGRTVLDEALK